jgi:hypothetical protein
VDVERRLRTRPTLCLPERIVQAIRGFLLGFRRDDSVISKTRATGILSA